MEKGFLFWLIFILFVLSSGWYGWTETLISRRAYVVMLLVMIALLGWRVFGPIVQ